MTEGVSVASGALAFTAGLLSLFSPCVLALVPAYIGYLSSSALSGGGRWHLVGRSLMFVLGFSAIFVLLGASATALGRQLWANRSIVRQVAGVLVVLLGLHQLGALRFGFLDVERRLITRLPGSRAGSPAQAPAAQQGARRWLGSGPWGAFFVGMAFAAGWSPCVGPVLASVLLLAGTARTVGAGVALLALYAAGMAVPFLLMAGIMERGAGRVTRWLGRYGLWVERASGALLILIGVALYTNFFLRLPGYLNYYRWFGL
ncbi:MAG: cytochrome c biogenesis protein CcdA [Bacillota bacterium]